MKIAILLSGEPRTFRECYPSLESNILSKNECDIFLHMYDDNDTSEVLRMYSPKKIIIENKNDIVLNISKLCHTNKPIETNVEGIFYQWRNINKVFNLICGDYDCVVKTRYDVKYTNPLYLKTFDMNMLNVPVGGDWRGGMFDMMAFGSKNIMSHYCSLYDFIEKYSIDGVQCHSEILNRHHNVQISTNRFEYTVLLRRQFDKGYIEDRVFTLR
jgi:hypothetical protein